MGGSRYIKLRLLLAVYILMIMTPTLSVDQAYSMDGPSNLLQKLHPELNKWNMDPCMMATFEGHLYFPTLKNSDFQEPMLKTENLDLINQLYVFLRSKVFPVTLNRKLLNLDALQSFLNEELKVLFPKYLEPSYEKCSNILFGGYFVSLICGCYLFLLLHKKVKNEASNSQETLQDFGNMNNAITSLSSMLNIKGMREISDVFSSGDETDKYSWIFKSLHRFPQSNCFVYPVKNTEYGRIASFSRLVHFEVPNDTSFIKLANAGFILTDKDLTVKCQECSKQEAICNFKSSPSEGKYHNQGCSFVQTEGCKEQICNFTSSLSEGKYPKQGCSFVQEKDYNKKQNGNIDSSSVTQSCNSFSSIKDNTFGPSHVIANSTSHDSILGATGNTSEPFEIMLSDTGFPQMTPAIDSGDFSDDAFQHTDDAEYYTESQDPHFRNKPDHNISTTAPTNSVNFSLESQKSLPVGGVEQKTDQHGITHLRVQKDLVGQREKINSESDQSSGYDSETEFDDSDLLQPEYEVCNKDLQISRETCKKNPGHFGYFPMLNFQMDYIPSKIRQPDVFRFFELVSNLTVRIVISKMSKARPKLDSVEDGKKCSYGTGYTVSEPESCYKIPDIEHTTHPGKWKTVQKYLHIMRHKHLIYIQTNRHLVYDETEAQSATVEFFYDNPNRKEIVIAKGISVYHSSILGDLRSILICKTSDLSLVKMIKESTNEIETVAQNFSLKIKEEMVKRVFMIGHPHGGQKLFCYGEYVMVKYALLQENVNGHTTARIVKINNNTQISQNPGNIRKTLLYTADTCNGSIGSPIVSFIKTGSGDSENIVLDMWMHNGLDKKNNLNASVMRVLTPDDVTNHGHTEIIRPSIQEDICAEAERAANQVVSCPVFNVLKPPSHPAYVGYVNRLRSYPDPFIHVHTAADLANGGFYYAGYGDCVRCFHCGLGLRSWKPGDVIHEEHWRNRPDCQFLQLKMREHGLSAVGLQSHHEQATASSDNLKRPVVDTRIEILEREQKYLKEMMTCKVCFQKPVKDLFLPCGELVACVDCSKLLTVCPSCNKKILATVTIYFS